MCPKIVQICLVRVGIKHPHDQGISESKYNIEIIDTGHHGLVEKINIDMKRLRSRIFDLEMMCNTQTSLKYYPHPFFQSRIPSQSYNQSPHIAFCIYRATPASLFPPVHNSRYLLPLVLSPQKSLPPEEPHCRTLPLANFLLDCFQNLVLLMVGQLPGFQNFYLVPYLLITPIWFSLS